MKEQFNNTASELLSNFNKQKTLNALQPLRNMGLEFKELKDNKWQHLTYLNFDNYHDAILLYDDNLKAYAIGFFKIM